MLHLFLLRGQDTVKIFRNQRGQRLGHRDVHAFFHRLGRPAEEHVPEDAFVLLVIDAGDAQLGPQFIERAIQRRLGDVAAQHLAQPVLRRSDLPSG